MREVIKNDKIKTILLTMSIKKITLKNTESNLETIFCIQKRGCFQDVIVSNSSVPRDILLKIEGILWKSLICRLIWILGRGWNQYVLTHNSKMDEAILGIETELKLRVISNW